MIYAALRASMIYHCFAMDKKIRLVETGRIFCLWAIKKIFLRFLGVDSDHRIIKTLFVSAKCHINYLFTVSSPKNAGYLIYNNINNCYEYHKENAY